MNVNLKKVLTLMQKQLNKEWDNISFEYSSAKDEVKATADITLNNHDDDIRVIITAYSGGGTVFRAVFDKIEKTTETLDALNDFNYDNPFFSAFIRDDDFLELRHYFICFEESMFKSYAGEFLSQLASLADDEYLQRLTSYTHD